MNPKKLSPELDQKLREYIKETHPHVYNFDYSISEDGKTITLSGNIKEYVPYSAVDGIDNIEKMLNVSFENITNVDGFFSYTYRFNK